MHDAGCNAANYEQLFRRAYSANEIVCERYGLPFEEFNDEMVHLYIGEWGHEQVTCLMNIEQGDDIERNK